MRMRVRLGMRRAAAVTQMAGRRRAGVSSRNTLLSSVRSRRKGITGTGSRMDRMNASSVQSARLARGSYDRLRKSSDSLTEQVKLLAEKVDAGGKDIPSTAAKVVEDFNDTLKYLRQTSGVLNDFYRQSLKETVAGKRKELESIGISVAMDGSLSLNQDKLAGAEEETVKKVLGASGDFYKRVTAVASRAADNARANAESISSQYTAAGGLLTGSYLSRYNLRG